MFELNELVLLSFRDELRKEAAVGSLLAKAAPYLRNASSLAGAGGAVGGLVGAGMGAVQGAREQSDHPILNTAAGAVRGGLRGAGLGALAGGVVGAAGGKVLRPDWLTSKGGLVGAGARFGQRQMHALTGALSPKELEGVRGGAYSARQASTEGAKKLTDLWNKGAPEEQIHGAVRGAIRAEKGLQASQKAQDMGLTSIPGYVGAVKREGLGKTLSTSLQDQWHNSHPAATALMVGAPLAAAAKTVASPESQEGAGKGEQLGKNIGNVVGGVVGGAMPLAGGIAAGEALQRVGGAVGRGVDRLRGKPRLVPAQTHTLGPPPLEPVESQNTPTERVTSPAAAGLPPEGI